jgi:putative restriction endonuclease
MAKIYGNEFPERPLMSVLSDLLGIDHFTTARGSTVRRDFLEAVGTGLGLRSDELRALRTKDEVLATVVQTATRQPMRMDLISPGGTVTNRALQVIIDGVVDHGVPGRLGLDHAAPEPLAEELPPFDPGAVGDERNRLVAEVAAREGQNAFRTAVMEAYGQRCAITGFDAVQALEAAHIYPYRGTATNVVSNGLLLRADLHRLFDRGALAIDENSYHVRLDPQLMVTEYAYLVEDEVRLRLPHRRNHHPSYAALRFHREWSGL